MIASNGDWPVATGRAEIEAREDFYKVVQKAIDDEAVRKPGG